MTSCPLSSRTRNMALDSASVTVPCTRMPACFAMEVFSFWVYGCWFWLRNILQAVWRDKLDLVQESSRCSLFFYCEEVAFEVGSKWSVSTDSPGFGQDAVAGDEWRQRVEAQCVSDGSRWDTGCLADLGIGSCLSG